MIYPTSIFVNKKLIEKCKKILQILNMLQQLKNFSPNTESLEIS